ncbi:DUF1800 domain-containing protein [Compostibacter hankyongensis]|uniref:DUF1800 domain-containing protein n=1 Tax=Compostibacter hankyongensis TaxID=1007089 RepID=A0ABP8FF18_9BACT
MDEQAKARHLCWRAGFDGVAAMATPGQPVRLKPLIRKMLQPSPEIAAITAPEIAALSLPGTARAKPASPEEKRALRKQQQQGIRHLNLAWLDTMVATSSPLQEKMSLFWHGHFACRVGNAVHNGRLLNVIRQHALGDFGTLLTAVSKSAAMLQFLNNQQNRKQHPNENFAREVMELFTMGRGNYTEDDVKEGARAFTGWAYDGDGNFRFRRSVHDNGVKTFLGKTGNFDGDDILKMLLEQRATAYHITDKLYRYFVNETPDEAKIKDLAGRFYQSNYDIRALMRHIFESDWFYDPVNTGNRIKSPVELLVGMRRSIPVTFARADTQLLVQRLLGQVLFYPPNVAGWPGGRSWIDSSTLMFRMRLPQIVYYDETLDMQPKDMPDEMMMDGPGRPPAQRRRYAENDRFVRNYARRIDADPHWDAYMKKFQQTPSGELPAAVSRVLLAGTPPAGSSALLKPYASAGREEAIKAMSVAVMSLPEYQLC